MLESGGNERGLDGKPLGGGLAAKVHTVDIAYIGEPRPTSDGLDARRSRAHPKESNDEASASAGSSVLAVVSLWLVVEAVVA